MWDFPLFPDQASTVAQQIDLVYYVLLGLGALFGVGVAVVLVYFAVKYRAGADVDRTNAVNENLKLEAAWTLIPLGLAMGMFVWGAVVYYDIETPPTDEPLEIYAVGKQWMWKFQHTNGVREINTLHVPRGRTIRMIMTSQDVIHSFYVPAFRIKKDVLPGRFTSTWFEAIDTGIYHLFCAEYCGTEHSYMNGDVVVMTPQGYEAWLRLGEEAGDEIDAATGRSGPRSQIGEGEPLPGEPADSVAPAREMAAAGAALFGSLRCNTCHRTDSTALRPATGPPLEGIFGRRVTLRNGRVIVAGEQYLLESIVHPYEKLVQGYPPVMPTYAGQLTETQLMQLVAYLKSISPPVGVPADEPTEAGGAATDTTEAPGPPSSDRGRQLFASLACNTCHRAGSDAESPTVGPSLYGLFGRSVELRSGATVVADAGYLRQSILNPQERIVAGYEPLMPVYEGRLTGREVDDLIAFIQSLGEQ